MFDAYRRSRAAAVSALTDRFPAVLAGFSTARPLRAVYKHTRGDPKNTPFAVIGQPSAKVSDEGAINSDVSLMVMVVASGANPDEIDRSMDDYLTAVVRTFAGGEFDGIYFSVVGFDADQPSPLEENSPLVQTCGVELRATLAESR